MTFLVQMVPPGANPEIRIRKFIFCVGGTLTKQLQQNGWYRQCCTKTGWLLESHVEDGAVR